MQTTTFSLIVVGSLLASSLAFAKPGQPPAPTYKRVDPSRVQAPAENVSSNIVYVHRCPEAVGCFVKTGSDDSRTDTSSIADGSAVLGEFPHGDVVWNAMFECVKATFAPFNITVTDVDPGDVPHFENMVGGRPSDITSDPNLQNAGGVAPFTCGEIPNAIVYTFAKVYDPDAEQLCWTSAQEIAHAFGLDHEFLSKDPLTYLPGDLPKRFRDEDARCGEFSERQCACPVATQNSYRRIVGLFGPGVPTPPETAFVRPADGREIQPGYKVAVHSVDDIRVAKVELYVDGTKVGESSDSVGDTFQVPLPLDTAPGAHMLEAHAIDVQDVVATVQLNVSVGPPCTAADGCTDTDVCVMGVCTPGPDEPGGLGYICQKDTECLSLQCADAGEDHKYCVEACATATPDSCPGGFDCIPGGADGVCWPSASGGCCDTSGTPAHAPMLLGFGVAFVLLRRRKRRA
jgi:hypothetical protein